jgi:hypothetical protein
LFYLNDNIRERIEETNGGFKVVNTQIVFSKEEMIEELKAVCKALDWKQAYYSSKPKKLDHQLLGHVLLSQEAVNNKGSMAQQLYRICTYYKEPRTLKKFNVELEILLPSRKGTKFTAKGKRDKKLELGKYNKKLEKEGDWVIIREQDVANPDSFF